MLDRYYIIGFANKIADRINSRIDDISEEINEQVSVLLFIAKKIKKNKLSNEQVVESLIEIHDDIMLYLKYLKTLYRENQVANQYDDVVGEIEEDEKKCKDIVREYEILADAKKLINGN